MDNPIQQPPLVSDSNQVKNDEQSVGSKNGLFNLIGVVLKSIVIDAGIIMLIVSVVIVVLNYFSIVQVSKIFPFLSFLPSNTQQIKNTENIYNFSNTAPETAPPADRMNLFSTNDYGMSLRKLIDSGSVESVMLEISYNAVIDSPMLKSSVDTPKGKQDVWKMTVHANKEVRSFKLYSGDLENLQVFQLTNGKNQQITYKELQAGDSIVVRVKIDILKNINSDIVITRITPAKIR